jgi:hypothetical protein
LLKVALLFLAHRVCVGEQLAERARANARVFEQVKQQ